MSLNEASCPLFILNRSREAQKVLRSLVKNSFIISINLRRVAVINFNPMHDLSAEILKFDLLLN